MNQSSTPWRAWACEGFRSRRHCGYADRGPYFPHPRHPGEIQMIERATRRGAAAVALFALLLAFVAACTGKDANHSPTATPLTDAASPTPAVDASVADASTRILAAYRGYQTAYQAAAAVPNPQDTALLKYIGDPLLTQVRQDLRLLKANGLLRRGTPKINTTVTVQLTATPPVATIQDCYDVSDVHVINKATGKSADAPGQATRYIVTSQAKFFGGSAGWLIVQSNADRNSTC
jgi:hypothetical protein